jgi:hypothetical protein
VDLRGHYMGMWTIVYTVGYGLGPLLGGQAMAVLGPRRAYLVVAAVGACGALAFWLLAAIERSGSRSTGAPPSATGSARKGGSLK